MSDAQNSQPASPGETIYSENPTTPQEPATPQNPPDPATPPAPEPAPAAEPLTLEALTVPEGFELDGEASSAFLDIMNNAELSPADRANALLDLQANLTRASSEAGSRAWEETRANWQQEVANDPEIGGENLTGTIEDIARVMDAYGNDDVRKAFDETGAGDHPAVVRFLRAVGASLKEAAPVQPPAAPTPSANQSPAAKLYPTMQQGSN